LVARLSDATPLGVDVRGGGGMTTESNGMRSTIGDVFDRCLDGWQSFDLEQAIAAFDTKHPGFLYQPMELERPVEDLAAYARSVRDQGIAEFVELRWTNIEYDVFGDFLWAYVDLVRHTVAPDGSEAKGPYRASAFLNRKDGDWKIIHYHESAQPYMPRPRTTSGAAVEAPGDAAPSADTLAAIQRAEDSKTLARTGEPRAVAQRMLETFIFGWEARDVELAYSWWDRDYDKHIYLALEIASPARTQKEMELYRHGQREDRIQTGMRWNWKLPLAAEDFRVDLVRDDLMLVYSNLHARPVPFDKPEPAERDAPYFTYRVSWLLRKTEGDWKIVHYHESRPTPGPTEVLTLGLHPSGPPGQS
jgi:ketosteroid isomerase-like protein